MRTRQAPEKLIVQFNDQHLKVFRALSHDNSPIHWDRAYARRTPLGGVVVYGIAGVLYGLGLWAQGRRFTLRSIKARFRRALYLGTDYEYRFEEVGNKVEVRLMRRESPLMEFSFEWEPWNGVDNIPSAHDSGFAPLPTANDYTGVPENEKNVVYTWDTKQLTEFQDLYGLSATQLPQEQLLSLLWSSYQVGMVWPGAQALYTSFDMRFRGGRNNDSSLRLDTLNYRFDDRFDMATISASTASADINITAFMRPKPVDYSLDSIRGIIASNDSLAGKNVLVLGGSRGFGWVLSGAFLLKGANVAINYRTEDNAVMDLKEQLSAFGDRVTFLQGDMGKAPDCERVRLSIERQSERLDYLVCNASPAIMAYPFAEMDTAEFTDFVTRSISICHRPLCALMPLLNANATVMNISSIYASKPPRNFSHYVTAKWAIEGLTRALASEFPDLRFVVARLPRMLTDQTNTNLDFESKVSAIEVASQLLERVLQGGESVNPLVVDFGASA